MLVEEMIKAIEILSVAPAFLRGIIDKQNYLRTLHENEDLQRQIAVFMQSSEKRLLQGKITPAGYYTGVWCRDASYILDELSHMGKTDFVGSWLEWIWDHQIQPSIRTVYGRGSPELGYRLRRADGQYGREFAGLLPSSIQYNYCEVFAKSPDIDSTALMISTTCKFLTGLGENHSFGEKLIPRIREAIASLEKRDVDGDSLLEQGPNEDWMDNMLRTGKIVYTQAAWIAALKDWQLLLQMTRQEAEAEIVGQKYCDVLKQVATRLWHNDSHFADDSGINERQERSQPRVTQDVSLLLLSTDIDRHKAALTLEKIKGELWKEKGVACAVPREKTGPRKLGQYRYQNGGFWPWVTALEILGRIKTGDYANAEALLKMSIMYSSFEWINPYGRQSGSYPFKTGIAAVRSAVRAFVAAPA